MLEENQISMVNGKENHVSQEVCENIGKQLASDKNTYVLYSSYNNDADLAIALSDGKIKVYPDCQLDSGFTLDGHEKPISDLKFSQELNYLVYSSSLDGSINSWDLRANKNPVQRFVDESDEQVKPLTSFDFNSNELLLCGGTEIIREDSFLIFWDKRNSATLGAYWESHREDITQVRFHPSSFALMASASVDGLINIFDLNETSEEDAIITTLNCEACVNKIQWNYNNQISAITSIEEYQLWSLEKVDPLVKIVRQDFLSKFKHHIESIVDSFLVGDSIYVATCKKDGHVSIWHSNENDLKFCFPLSDGHTDIIRTISWNCKKNILATGGEDGLICLWKCPE